MNAAEWFKTYFDLCGDFQPNSNEIHLDQMKLNAMYSEYKAELDLDEECLLSYRSWREVWLNEFSNVKLRQFKAVSGMIYLLPLSYA